METKNIEAVLTTVTIDTKVDAGKIETVIGESAKMEVQKAVNYIQSGKAEIDAAVDARLAEIDAEGQEYVDLAKDWAIKTDGTVDGVDYSSKYYAQSILPISSEIVTVAGISSEVSAVGGAIGEVTSVANDLTNIDNVADDLTNIDTVAGISSDISTTAGIASNISAVAANETNINAVNANKTNIDAVAGNETNINSVASNETNINAVAGNSSNINTVAGISSDVTTVANNTANINNVVADLTNINNVASDLTNINNVASDLTNIDTVAADVTNIDNVAAGLTNIDTVASNISNVNAAAGDIENINAVAADLTNIDNASSFAADAKQWAIGDPSEPSGNSAKYWAEEADVSETNAEIWAEGTDEEVRALGGVHSSKGWANQSAQGQVQSDWAEADPTSKAYILNKPTIPQALSTNIADVVGTYAELQAYNTSTLPVNSIIEVLEDSNNSNKHSYYRWVSSGSGGAFVQPVMSADGTIGGDSFAVAMSSVYSGRPAWYAFDGVTTPNPQWTNVAHTGNSMPAWFEFYNPVPICVTKMAVTNGNINPINYQFQASSDGTTWITLVDGVNQYATPEADWRGYTWAFDVPNTDYYKYYRFYVTSGTYLQYCSILEFGITATEEFSAEWQLVNDKGPFVPTSRTINSKALSSNVTLTASDVGAYPDNNPSGYITGINSSDVTTALGYTPVNPSSLATVATSGSYNDLSNKPTIPTVNNATLTIQKNGTTVKTFTANASSNVTANITVPTNTNELTNGAGFITGISSSDVTTALGYTPANDTNVVKTSGNQIIADRKTFTGISHWSKTGTAISLSNPNIAGETWDIKYSSGNNLVFTGRVLSGGTWKCGITYKLAADVLELNANNGVTAPTPATGDNSKKIATTAFVNNYITANTSNVHVVVETYKSGSSWYRIYDDGWIEQGGWKSGFSSANTFENVTLHKPFADTYYNVQVSGGGSATTIYNYKIGNSEKNTTTAFKLLASNTGAACFWYACGMGA